MTLVSASSPEPATLDLGRAKHMVETRIRACRSSGSGTCRIRFKKDGFSVEKPL